MDCRVELFGCEYIPNGPDQERFEALFALAWEQVPGGRRPRVDSAKGLAVDLMLVDDEEIAEMNRRFMNHEGPTDVLSFPIGEFEMARGAWFCGEIVVGFETAVREARDRCLTFENELCRYALHGFLHLLGYEDKEPEEQDAMTDLQEHILALFFRDR